MNKSISRIDFGCFSFPQALYVLLIMICTMLLVKNLTQSHSNSKFKKKKISKKFSKKFFGRMGGYIEKKDFFAVSEKNFFPQNSLKIINVGTDPL